MKVREFMSGNPCYISKNDTLEFAAKKMQEFDCGFLPVGDNDRIDGVITDRDITLRAVAQGKNPSECKAGDCMTSKVLYCAEDDDLDFVSKSMKEQQVYRLIVLNNRSDKRLSGVISLGDVSRQGSHDKFVGETAEFMKKAA